MHIFMHGVCTSQRDAHIEVMRLTSRLHESRIQPYIFCARQLLSEGDGGQLMVGSITISKAQTS